MDQLAIYRVFTNSSLGFKGNTAAIVLVEAPLNNEQMQSIASDLNQPATTFLWKGNLSYQVRWFAPDEKIGLCGHGAFAALAFLRDNNMASGSVKLKHEAGEITGNLLGANISMKLDTIPVIKSIKVPQTIQQGLGIPILEMFETGNKHIILTAKEKSIHSLKPDFSKLRESKIFGYAVTAPGDQVDFVSRTLVPHVQQLEDHATGSSHAMLTPFWAERLGKTNMLAHQLSPRGGYFKCELKDQQVILSGEYNSLATGTLQTRMTDF